MTASFYDNNGKLFIDCSECARTLCKNAWKTTPYNGGCYDGILHYNVDKAKIKSVIRTTTKGGLICDLR